MDEKNNIRSEYIKSLVEDKNEMERSLEETTKKTLQAMLGDKLNESIRSIISESPDDFDVEEVDADDQETEEGDASTDKEDNNASVDAGAKGDEEEVTGDEMWDELEDFKDDDGEYDLTGMGNDDVIKVLKVMGPEDGVRVVKNDNGTIKLSDDESEKEYIIDIEGDFDDETGELGDDDAEIEIELDDELTDESFAGRRGRRVNEGNVNLGYTDDYQDRTAMTTPNNDEPANPRATYSMDAGVPKGTAKPWVGHKGDMSPYGKSGKVNEGDDEQLDETMTSTENSANVRGDGMTHANTNSKGKKFRSSSEGGQRVKGTGENSYSEAQVESIKRMANNIYRENKQLKNIAEQIKTKLQEAIVVNSSLGNIVKIITENSTTKEEKKSIINRFNDVRTVNEGKRLYKTITEELKASSVSRKPSQDAINESRENDNRLVETAIYQSDDLPKMLNLMERLEKIR
ncbi:MAG: hypothetical protein J6Y37_16320 [Paludibacteraceae bacterium]|nr:hypothetical protein [Paludibacteraceae bacterium]